jgi:hypothetical protein
MIHEHWNYCFNPSFSKKDLINLLRKHNEQD